MTPIAAVPETRDVALDELLEPPLPSRSAMDEQKLDELAASIKAVGLLQPIIVARVEGGLEIIAGHRRYHACRRAGLTVAPCRVYPDKQIPAVVMQAHENAKREDLNPADEALWFAELLERHCGGDYERLAGLVGESYGYVEGRLRLLAGDRRVFDALRAGAIRIGVARELNDCDDDHMRNYFLQVAVRGGATQAAVGGWIAEWRQQHARAAPATGDAAPAAALAPVTFANPFTCYICGRTDHVEVMRPLQVHEHCRLAILDELLGSHAGRTA